MKNDEWKTYNKEEEEDDDDDENPENIIKT